MHGAMLAPGSGIFGGDQLLAVATESVSGLAVAERLGTRGQRLPVLAELPGSERLHALVLAGQGLRPSGSAWRVVWPEELEESLLGATLFTGTRGARLPAGWRVGLVVGHREQELELQHPAFDVREHALFAIEGAAAEEGGQR